MNRWIRRFADWLLNRRGFDKLGLPLRVRPSGSPYENWLESARSRLPVHDCLCIENVRSTVLERWEDMGAGVTGLYLRLADYQFTDGRLFEIPAGGATAPAQHFFELGVHFLGGPGHTLLFEEGRNPVRIEWANRSVLSIPLNTRYQHVNPGPDPVRILAISNFPFMLNTLESEHFIDKNPFHFAGRRVSDADSASLVTEDSKGRRHCDLIPDALAEELTARPVRGKGVRNQYWTLAGNTMLDINLSELDGGEIKRAHRANSEATVLMLSGTGCFVAWPDGAWHRHQRVEWQDGTLITFPIYWYRQFLNPGRDPSRNLTFSAKSLVQKLGLRFLDQMESDLPEIRKLWKDLLRRHSS